MIVIVGGQCRKCGKTRAVCDIIAATREAGWTAVKVTSHSHDQGRRGDTERYLEAGATSALLVHSVQDVPADRNIIIESNAAAEEIRPDLFLFVADPSIEEWKDSAGRVVSRADYRLDRFVTEEVIRRIRDTLSVQYPRPPVAET